MSDELENRLRELIEVADEGVRVRNADDCAIIAALSRALLAYRDYVHKDKDTEEIDADLLKAFKEEV